MINQIKARKIIEVSHFVVCNRCLYIFEEISKGSRFYDIKCPNCHEMIWLTLVFDSNIEAIKKKEEILKKRESKLE
jgi:hypothetical protein